LHRFFNCLLYCKGSGIIKEKEEILARDNYSYKKYQKELARKKKNEEKRQSKLNKKNIETKTHLTLSDGECASSAVDTQQASNENVTLA